MELPKTSWPGNHQVALPDWLLLVRQKLQDTRLEAQRITDADLVRAISEAVNVYSKARPRERIAALIGDGSSYQFSLPSDFHEGFSAVTQVEHPTAEQIPSYLDDAAYTVRRLPTGALVLQFYGLTLPTAEEAWISYRARHIVFGGDDTVPLIDREAVAGLATAFLFRELSAYYAQTTDSTINADAVSYRTKSQEYLTLATALEDAYRRHVGIDGHNTVAASVSADLDVFLIGGYDRFYHSARWR